MKLATDLFVLKLRRTSNTSVLAIVLSAVLLVCFAQTTALAQCTLSSPTTWTDGNGDFNTPGNWNSGAPNSSTNACITDGTSQVSLGVSETGNVLSLQIGSGNSLTMDLNTALFVSGTQIINNGQFNVDGGSGTNSQLR